MTRSRSLRESLAGALSDRQELGRLATVGLISLGHGFQHWYSAAFWVVLPFLARDLGLSFTQAGLVVTIRMAVGAVANVPGAAAIDLYGRQRLVLAASVALGGVAYGLLALAPSYGLLILAVSFLGLGGSLWHPAGMSSLSRIFPHRKGLALSAHETGANLGDLLAPLAVGGLVGLLAWPVVAQGHLAVGLVGAAVLGLLGPTFAPARRGAARLRQHLRGLASLLSGAELRGLTLVSGMRTAAEVTLTSFLPLYLAYDLGFSVAQVGVYPALLRVSGLITGPIAGTISDAIGRKAILSGFLALSTTLVLIMALSRQGVTFLVALFLLGLFLYSVRPVLFASALDLTPPDLGASVVGTIFMVNMVLAAATPAAAGYLSDALGLVATFYLVGGLLLVGTALTLAVRLPAPSAGRATARESEPL